jgi:hypothetical protein
MYAILATVDISDAAARTKVLEEQAVPAVREAPGFVAAYWVRLDGGQGASLVVFESEEQARAGAPEEGSSISGWATFTSVRIGEVVARA